MRKTFTASLVLFMLTVAAAAQAPQATLTADQQKVLDYLLAHWGRDTAVTGIDLGMKIVGGHYTAEDRYALAVYIREHPEIHRVVRTFGWVPVALTREEKVTARLLSRAEREQRSAPTMAQLSRAVEARPTVVRESLRMLERLGIVRADATAGGVGYRMANDDYVNWEGTNKIDFMYHRVQIEGQDPLDTY
jgi:hypothetical protein